jgi:hypothetical protein
LKKYFKTVKTNTYTVFDAMKSSQWRHKNGLEQNQAPMESKRPYKFTFHVVQFTDFERLDDPRIAT